MYISTRVIQLVYYFTASIATTVPAVSSERDSQRDEFPTRGKRQRGAGTFYRNVKPWLIQRFNTAAHSQSHKRSKLHRSIIVAPNLECCKV